MTRKCPGCKSVNVRRSSTPAAELTWRNEVFSRYRCRDCMLQFWGIGRKTYLIAGAFVAALAAIFLIVLVVELLTSPDRSSTNRQPRVEALPQERLLAAAEIPFADVAGREL